MAQERKVTGHYNPRIGRGKFPAHRQQKLAQVQMAMAVDAVAQLIVVTQRIQDMENADIVDAAVHQDQIHGFRRVGNL